MKKPIVLMVSLLGGLLLLFSSSWGNGEKDGKEKLAGEAKITIQEAIEAATAKVPGKVIEAELESEHGTTVWEIEIVTTTKKVVHVDATSGKVIDVEEDD